MSSECTAYCVQAIKELSAVDVKDPTETFWAGFFTCLCEQVMMRVKPAAMVDSEMPRAEEVTRVVAAVYDLYRERLEKPTGGYEIWVCRPDDEDTLADLTRLREEGLDWGEYHSLRGRLCGYPSTMIRRYTDGVWP